MGSCGLSLPCTQTIKDSKDALEITNKGSGAALSGKSNSGPGVSGQSLANAGVFGEGPQSGVHGRSASVTGDGVRGENVAGGCGVSGSTNTGTAADPAAMWGDNAGYGAGVKGTSQGVGVYGYANGTGVYGRSDGFRAVAGESDTGAGVYGYSYAGEGVHGETRGGDQAGVVAINNAFGGFARGLLATSESGDAVWAEGRNAVIAVASKDWSQNVALYGRAQSERSIAVYGTMGPQPGAGARAGYFYGPVEVAGSLYKLGGGFKIDHPLHPDAMYLTHSFVESSEMKNIYDGVVTLNGKGAARVKLPKWFEALNRDFRYQLTPIGGPAPDLHIAQGISANGFAIAGGKAGMKVSWQVTGVRKDAWAEANPIEVESKKAPHERGRYIQPSVHGQPEESGIMWTMRPENLDRKPPARAKRVKSGKKSKRSR